MELFGHPVIVGAAEIMRIEEGDVNITDLTG